MTGFLDKNMEVRVFNVTDGTNIRGQMWHKPRGAKLVHIFAVGAGAGGGGGFTGASLTARGGGGGGGERRDNERYLFCWFITRLLIRTRRYGWP